MRTRKEIEGQFKENRIDGTIPIDIELLLDIRDLLTKPIIKQEGLSKEALKEQKKWEES